MSTLVEVKNGPSLNARRVVDTGDGYLRLEGISSANVSAEQSTENRVISKSDVKSISGKVEDAR